MKPLPDLRRDTGIVPETTLRIFQTSGINDDEGTHWRINGHPATIFIWTAEEWEQLETRPADAQRHPSGSWCVLRMD